MPWELAPPPRGREQLRRRQFHIKPLVEAPTGIKNGLVRGNGPAETPQLKLAEGSRIDGFFDSPDHGLADQDLTRRGVRAEPGGKVRHRPERTIVIAAFEADPAKRRVTCLDSASKAEVCSTLPAHLRQFREPPLRRNGALQNSQPRPERR